MPTSLLQSYLARRRNSQPSSPPAASGRKTLSRNRLSNVTWQSLSSDQDVHIVLWQARQKGTTSAPDTDVQRQIRAEPLNLEDLFDDVALSVIENEDKLLFGLAPAVMIFLDLSKDSTLTCVVPSALLRAARQCLLSKLPPFARPAVFILTPQPQVLFRVWKETLSSAVLHFITEWSQDFYQSCFDCAKAMVITLSNAKVTPPRSYGRFPVLLSDRATLMWGLWANESRTELLLPDVKGQRWFHCTEEQTQRVLETGTFLDIIQEELSEDPDSQVSPTTASPENGIPGQASAEAVTPGNTYTEIGSGAFFTVTPSTPADDALSPLNSEYRTPTPYLNSDEYSEASAEPIHRGRSSSYESVCSENIAIRPNRIRSPMSVPVVATPRGVPPEITEVEMQEDAPSESVKQDCCCSCFRRFRKSS